jgi:hypothetical protein
MGVLKDSRLQQAFFRRTGRNSGARRRHSCMQCSSLSSSATFAICGYCERQPTPADWMDPQSHSPFFMREFANSLFAAKYDHAMASVAFSKIRSWKSSSLNVCELIAYWAFFVLAELAGSRSVRRPMFQVLTSVSAGCISHI